MIPLVLMGAAAQTPSCVEQHPANEPSVTAAKTTPEDLSLYRPEDLEVYQARCDQEIKAAIDRGDNAGVHSWARTLGEFRHWAADLMARGVGTTKPANRRSVGVENPEPLFRTCERSATSRNWGMPPKNNYYNEVILNDPTLTEGNPVAGHEIQVIVGSPSKVAKGTLVEFAKELTEHVRANQRWSGVHVTVEPIELQDLPPLGEPRHIEGDLTAWILE